MSLDLPTVQCGDDADDQSWLKQIYEEAYEQQYVDNNDI